MGSLDKNILEKAWDATKEAGSYVQGKAVEGAKAVGEAYDSVTGKAKTATDKMVGYVQGDIAIPKASEDPHGMRPKLKAALKGVIPDDKIEQFLDQDKITSEQVEMIVKPALMTNVNTRSKLLDLKSAFRTHNDLRDLVDTYGIAPIDPNRKVAIPTARVKSSDLLREMKLGLSTSKATFYKSARALLGISDTDMDDISLGRHIVALKAQALAETVDAVMGRTQNSKNAETLTNKGLIFDTNGSWQESIAGNDLAEALASTNSDHLDVVGREVQRYSRTTINNDYIRTLMAAAADPSEKGRSLTIMGKVQNFSEDEPEKLMQIADELEAMRQGISSVDPDIFRKTTSEVENVIKTGKDFVVAGLTIPYLAVMAVLKGGVPMWLLIGHIAHMKAGTGEVFIGKSKIAKALSVTLTPGYVTYSAQRAFNKQEVAPTDTAELAKRQKAHIAPDDAYITTMKEAIEKDQVKCIDEIKRLKDEIKRLESIREPSRGDTMALEDAKEKLGIQEKWKSELGRRNNLFSKALDGYKKRFETGTFRTNHDSKNGLQTFFRSIKEGKITTIGGAFADIVDPEKNGVKEKTERAVKRPVEAVKRRWFTPGDIVDADVEAKKARKGARADPLIVTRADGTEEKITLEKTEYKTAAENLMYELERFYKLKEWGSLYTTYKLAMSQEAKAQASTKDARVSSVGGISTPTIPSHATVHVTMDKSDIAASVNAEAKKSEKVVEIAEKMAALNLGSAFDPNKLQISGFDASGNAIFDEGEIKGNKGFYSQAKALNTRKISSLWTKSVDKGGLGMDKDKLPNFETIKDVYRAKGAVVQELKM